MGKSAAFARIKRQVLELVQAIPAGHVVTFGQAGDHLDVMARHVAYILATLSPEEEELTPWHRVVPEGGRLKLSVGGRVIRQAALLQEEGIEVGPGGRLDGWSELQWSITTPRGERPGQGPLTAT